MAKWQPEAKALVAERFRLVRELGRGGMGAVWMAHHEGLDIECALKFIVGEGDSAELRSRFRQEARAAAKLKSRHVVQMLDHGVWKDTPYIAMELLRGESLACLLERRGKLDADETLAIARDVGKALTAAAELGIVHRDLKPENVFLVGDGAEECAKVLDFGIAKTTHFDKTDHRTQTGALLGTPYYMSPEQLDGTMLVDHRSDLWSLGVMVYECLVGALPFQEETLSRLTLAIMQKPVPIPSETAPWLGQSFDRWWLRAASRDTAKRFQSAGELTSALARALDDAPLSSGDEPTQKQDMREVLAAAGVQVSRPDVTLASAQAPRFAVSSGTLRAATGSTVLEPGTLGGQATPSFRERRRRLLYGVTALAIVGLVALVWATSGPPTRAEEEAMPASASLEEPAASASIEIAPTATAVHEAPVQSAAAAPSAPIKDATSARPLLRPAPPSPRRPQFK
jgi:serine/threonine-protein kinase